MSDAKELLELARKFVEMAEENPDFTCIEELLAAFAASPAVVSAVCAEPQTNEGRDPVEIAQRADSVEEKGR